MAKTIEASLETPVTPSIDPAEVAKFSAMAADWWNPNGKFKPLHRFNPVRLKFIRETAETHFSILKGALKPLERLRLLDIGCGGGLVCEPMARLGAAVTGVDASEANIKTALTHAAEQGLKIDYRAGTAEGLLAASEPLFDIVLNLEVVEHVADPAQFLADTARLVRPGGLMIVATLNRTAKALPGRHYSVASAAWAQKPFNFADFTRAARFINSLQNGKVLVEFISAAPGSASSGSRAFSRRMRSA